MLHVNPYPVEMYTTEYLRRQDSVLGFRIDKQRGFISQTAADAL